MSCGAVFTSTRIIIQYQTKPMASFERATGRMLSELLQPHNDTEKAIFKESPNNS